MTNETRVILLSREVTERLGFWDGYSQEQKDRCSKATKLFWQKLLARLESLT
jgi:hypothetical protein